MIKPIKRFANPVDISKFSIDLEMNQTLGISIANMKQDIDIRDFSKCSFSMALNSSIINIAPIKSPVLGF